MAKAPNAKKPNVVQQGRTIRETIKAGAKPLDAERQALVLALLREGATPLEIVRHKGMPSLASIWATRDADAKFKVDFDNAVANGARAMLAEAQELARDATVSNDPDAVRVADMYMRVTQSYVEKLAPREFGQLVKLAGDADQAAITVQVVNFSNRATEPDKG